MKNFIKPTKVTLITVFFVVILFLASPLYIIFLFLPLALLDLFGVNTSAGEGWFNITSSAEIFALSIDLLFIWFLASGVSFLWYKFRPKPKLPETS